MATQYRIRAKNSNTGNIFYVDIIGAFDPETDIKDPAAPSDPVDQDSITIVGTTTLPEEFSLKDNYGIQAVSIIPTGLSSFDSVSHDFCDKTTWWQEAATISDETLTTSDDLTFNFAHPNVINYVKATDSDKVPSNKKLKIYIDGDAIDPYDDGSVATIGFTEGTITFNTSQAGKVITADYAYVDESNPNKSRWTITPAPGTVIALTAAKVKMSKNLTYNDTMVFNIGINPLIVPGGIAAQRKYYALRDFIGFSSRWEVLPAIGEYTSDIIHMLYDYKGSIILDSALGMYAELHLDHNTPHDGEIGLVTFQCVKLKG